MTSLKEERRRIWNRIKKKNAFLITPVNIYKVEYLFIDFRSILDAHQTPVKYGFDILI
jgi:hypothetical protein